VYRKYCANTVPGLFCLASTTDPFRLPNIGGTVRADATVWLAWQTVGTAITVENIKNFLAFCCFSVWFAKCKWFNYVFVTKNGAEFYNLSFTSDVSWLVQKISKSKVTKTKQK
jgi:hypothetical protein